MEESFINRSQSEVGVLITPITTFLGKKEYLYTLTESAYGEWIIFNDNIPKYYFNVFDTAYSALFDSLKKLRSVEEFLENNFKKVNSNLSIRQQVFGIKHKNKSFTKRIVLEKLPVNFLIGNND